jgi:hypothetical protein
MQPLVELAYLEAGGARVDARGGNVGCRRQHGACRRRYRAAVHWKIVHVV